MRRFEISRKNDVRSILFFKDRINYNIKRNKTKEINERKYKIVAQIQFVVDPNFWEKYVRTGKSIMKAVANICSVSITVYSVVKLLFKMFYSSNFDNYKIMQNLLIQTAPNITNKNKVIKKDEKSSDFLLNSPVDNNKLIVADDENKNENNKNINDEETGYLPKLNFLDYILNTFYCNNCCCNSKRQKLISKCNNFISKYYSIENILLLQIKLENILKDYKWNDDKLRNFENNESIEDIKKCASNIFIEYIKN